MKWVDRYEKTGDEGKALEQSISTKVGVLTLSNESMGSKRD